MIADVNEAYLRATGRTREELAAQTLQLPLSGVKVGMLLTDPADPTLETLRVVAH